MKNTLKSDPRKTNNVTKQTKNKDRIDRFEVFLTRQDSKCSVLNTIF